MNLDEPIEITQQVTQTLDSIGIPYFIGGSLASSLHGMPRATQDVDLIIDINPKSLFKNSAALKPSFFCKTRFFHTGQARQSVFENRL